MTKSTAVEALGYIAASLTTGSFIPGVYTVWRERPKPAKDVSFTMYIAMTLGLGAWLVYGLLITSWPIIIANLIAVFLSASILAYKLIYG